MLMTIIIVIVFILLFLPQIWAKRTMAKYDFERSDIPGTGSQFANHLIKKLNLNNCQVVKDESGLGDHYDPRSKTVSLSGQYFSNKSLTALVVASHEIGHAYQHHIGYKPLQIRTQLVTIANLAERIASLVLIASPIITFVTKMPIIGAIVFMSAFCIMALPVLIHLITLPTEFDASFKRALPILASGYLNEEELKIARKILLACSLTYVAASLAGLLNLWRWIRLLRR